MTQPAKSQEPSMEEILASIRRIIADDDATKTAPRAPEAPKAELPPEPPYPPSPSPPPPQFEPDPIPAVVETAAEPSDILDLTETMAASMPQPNSQFRTIDGTSDVGFDDAGDRPAAPPVERGHLVSNETSAAVDSAFSALAQTVLVQNARTLEDLVREMLRPMLKSWLDDNLPGMVERLVRAEIERVSRGRTG
jgi:cell pole-organizing protein PopZ